MASKLDRLKCPGPEEWLQGLPPREGYLRIPEERLPAWSGENEGPDENRWKDRRVGSEIIQRAEQRGGGKLEPDLFPGFPDRGVEQICIAHAPPPTRKCELTGPSVALTLGSPDQQDGIGIGSENDGDGRARTGGVFGTDRICGGEEFREGGEPAQCE